MKFKQLSQRSHRLLVASIGAVILSFYLPFVDDRDWLTWLVTLIAVILVFILTYSLGAIFNGPNSKLDERQLAAKLGYWQRAYWFQLIITAWVVIAQLFIDAIEAHILLATLVFAIVCLPALVTAWLEPDPITDEGAEVALGKPQ